jgi:DNA-binding transcriptional LysR family regulator
MTASLLVPVLREWRIERPEVQIDLEEFTSSDRMEEYLSSGQADFGVGLRPTATELVVEVLGREQIVVVCSPEHRFTRRDSIAVAELAKEPFVRYHHSNGVTDWVDQFAARHELSLSPVLRTRSPRTAAHLASAGMGVTIVPMSAITVRSGGTVRPFAPAVHRDVVALVAAPADSLARRFVTELARRGVPAAEELVAP